MKPQRSPRLAFAPRSKSPAHKRPNGGSCAPALALQGSYAILTAPMKHELCSAKSTTGSPKASSCPILRTREPCLTSYRANGFEETVRCSKCGTEDRQNARFCDGCGSGLQPQCASCGTLNRLEAKFCDGCGAPLIGVKPPAASTNASGARLKTDIAAADELDGERKTVTALFADIKGSTELMADLDPEEARSIVDPALKLMIDAVRRYDGYVVQSTGDGIFALFGAPLAHEDHPQCALYAALRMQEELRRYSAKLVSDGGSPIQGRIGVNTGEVVVRALETGQGHAEYTPIGHSTNLAARMQTAAPVGSIAVTEATRSLVEGYFTLKALGATRVKGLSGPVNMYEVTGRGLLRTRLQRAAARGLTKFVGRQREMDMLRHALEQARAGHGQIIAAMADPGVG